jgi:hypothetical protein
MSGLLPSEAGRDDSRNRLDDRVDVVVLIELGAEALAIGGR